MQLMPFQARHACVSPNVANCFMWSRPSSLKKLFSFPTLIFIFVPLSFLLPVALLPNRDVCSPSCGPWSDCLWFGLSDYYPPVVWEGTLLQAGNKPSFSALKECSQKQQPSDFFWDTTGLNLLLYLSRDILAIFSGGIINGN